MSLILAGSIMLDSTFNDHIVYTFSSNKEAPQKKSKGKHLDRWTTSLASPEIIILNSASTCKLVNGQADGRILTISLILSSASFYKHQGWLPYPDSILTTKCRLQAHALTNKHLL